jgi:hypothetical protein
MLLLHLVKKFKVYQIKGEATVLLGAIYIILGVFLEGIVVIRCFV